MKFTSTSGRARRFSTVPGERMFPNATHPSSTTTNVAFGETAGVPSPFVVATEPALNSSMSRIIGFVSFPMPFPPRSSDPSRATSVGTSAARQEVANSFPAVLRCFFARLRPRCGG